MLSPQRRHPKRVKHNTFFNFDPSLVVCHTIAWPCSHSPDPRHPRNPTAHPAISPLRRTCPQLVEPRLARTNATPGVSKDSSTGKIAQMGEDAKASLLYLDLAWTAPRFFFSCMVLKHTELPLLDAVSGNGSRQVTTGIAHDGNRQKHTPRLAEEDRKDGGGRHGKSPLP